MASIALEASRTGPHYVLPLYHAYLALPDKKRTQRHRVNWTFVAISFRLAWRTPHVERATRQTHKDDPGLVVRVFVVPLCIHAKVAEAFDLLTQQAQLLQGQKLVVFLDEIPWLAGQGSKLLDELDYFKNGGILQYVLRNMMAA